jgi:hypothetical protein
MQMCLACKPLRLLKYGAVGELVRKLSSICSDEAWRRASRAPTRFYAFIAAPIADTDSMQRSTRTFIVDTGRVCDTTEVRELSSLTAFLQLLQTGPVDQDRDCWCTEQQAVDKQPLLHFWFVDELTAEAFGMNVKVNGRSNGSRSVQTAAPARLAMRRPVARARVAPQAGTPMSLATCMNAEGKFQLVSRLIDAKESAGVTLDDLADKLGVTNVYAGQLLYNQV